MVSCMCGCEPWGFQALNKTPNSVGWLAEMGCYLKVFTNPEHLPESWPGMVGLSPLTAVISGLARPGLGPGKVISSACRRMLPFLLFFFFFKIGTSLVVQWLRLLLPMQDVWVQSLVGKLRSHMTLDQKNQNIKKRSNVVTNSIKALQIF